MGGLFQKRVVKRVAYSRRELSNGWLFPKECCQMGGFFQKIVVKWMAYSRRELSKGWLFPEESCQKGGLFQKRVVKRVAFSRRGGGGEVVETIRFSLKYLINKRSNLFTYKIYIFYLI